MKKLIKVTIFLIFVGFSFTLLTPTPTSAQGLAQLAECSGPDCGTCEIIKLANGLIMWLIGFVFLLFALLLMRAGIKLVTSGGNPGALQDAKDSFINALVGFIIILAAWLIVDTIMRALVGDERTGALVWSEIECTAQVTPRECTVANGCVEFVELEDQRDLDEDGNPIDPFPDDDGVRGEGYTLALRQGGSVTVGRCDTSVMQTIPFLGHRVTIQENLVPSLQRIDARWRSRGGNSYYEVRSVGGYNCRGGYHGYGLAIDINPPENPHCPTWPACNGQNILITDMEDSRFYDLFKSEGWGWGGEWRTSKDAMHFSKGINERGNMVGDAI